MELIVYKLKDNEGAIDYCIDNSTNSKQLRKKLFSKLLSCYALAKWEFILLFFICYTIQFIRDNIDFSENAAQLFNNKLVEFDLSKVLETIPLNWSLNKISDFLQRNLIKLTASKRNISIKKSLCNYQNLSFREDLMKLKNKKFVLNDQRYTIYFKNNNTNFCKF